MDLPSPELWTAFEDGCRFDTPDGQTELRCRDIGSLALPTGRIVACDPLFDLFQEPFSFGLAPGTYPVFLSITDQNEIALLMIQFSDSRPVKWRRAKPGSFSVDSATAAFMDQKLARMRLRSAANHRLERHWKQVTDEMEENAGLWSNVCLHPDSGANLIAFPTLGGDGTFHSFVGYSTKNRPVCLVTDFFLGEIALGKGNEPKPKTEKKPDRPVNPG